jgi:hypothetical protein
MRQWKPEGLKEAALSYGGSEIVGDPFRKVEAKATSVFLPGDKERTFPNTQCPTSEFEALL